MQRGSPLQDRVQTRVEANKIAFSTVIEVRENPPGVYWPNLDSEYVVERKFRETRLYQVAPISTNLILSYISEHVFGLPRSF